MCRRGCTCVHSHTCGCILLSSGVTLYVCFMCELNFWNNFQLTIRFSGKSEFHAYYCGINAYPQSASLWRWNLWQLLQITYKMQWKKKACGQPGKWISITCHFNEKRNKKKKRARRRQPLRSRILTTQDKNRMWSVSSFWS